MIIDVDCAEDLMPHKRNKLLGTGPMGMMSANGLAAASAMTLAAAVAASI